MTKTAQTDFAPALAELVVCIRLLVGAVRKINPGALADDLERIVERRLGIVRQLAGIPD